MSYPGLPAIVFVTALTFIAIIVTSDTAAHASDGKMMSSIDVLAGNKTYPVIYQMSNGGSINSVTADPSILSMYIAVTSPADGYLDLTFPREMYDALSFTEHGGPIVFADGEESYPIEISQSCEQTSVRIPVRAGTEKIDLVYPDILMEHSHGYPQLIDLFENIQEKEGEFSIRLLTDAIKCNVSFVKEEKKIHIDIEGRDETRIPTATNQGFFRLTVPHDLLGGNYTILVDGRQVNFKEDVFFTNNNTDIGAEFVEDDRGFKASHLTFSYPPSASTVDVIGTSAVPEFGYSLMTVIMAVSIAGVIIAAKRIKW